MTRQRAGASRPPVDDSTEAAERATLDEVLAELGGDAYEIVLFRQNPSKPTEWPYMGGFPADSFSLDSMKLEHGGGNYRARILAPGKKFRRQITFQIDGPPKAYPIAPAPAAPAAPAAETSAILEAIKGQTELLRTVALELRRPAAPASDPLEYGLKIAALVTQAGGKGGGQALGIADMLELLDRGMELAGNGDGGGYGTVVREFGKPLLELLQKMADRPTAGDPRRFNRNFPPADPPVQNGNAAPAEAHVANPPGAPMGLPRWLAHLAPLVPQGLRLATLGLEPESFAPALYQLVPESDLTELEAAAADPNFSLAVLEAYPDTQQYREWFTRLLEAVRELILEGAKEDSPAGTDG